ncbi:hypothetical protein MMC30_003109 [Trapelia coarctata]|nr:hypothetical protein [Trapelia coarctata]
MSTSRLDPWETAPVQVTRKELEDALDIAAANYQIAKHEITETLAAFTDGVRGMHLEINVPPIDDRMFNLGDFNRALGVAARTKGNEAQFTAAVQSLYLLIQQLNRHM